MIDKRNVIVDLLNKEGSLTINKIAKHLRLSYGSIHSYINQLKKEKIIDFLKVGNAYLCSLNYDNEYVLGILIKNSFDKKIGFFKNKKELENKIENIIKDIKKKKIVESVFFLDNNLYTILNNKITIKNINKKNIKIIKKEEQKNLLQGIKIKDIVIICGFENFWRTFIDLKKR